MNLSYLYLKKILEEELRDHDCQCQLNPDFTVTISCRVGGPHGALYIVPNSDFLKSSSFSDLSSRRRRAVTGVKPEKLPVGRQLEAPALNATGTA